MDKSNISWTDGTWNPWTGCDKVGGPESECANCYISRVLDKQGLQPWGKIYRAKTTWDLPYRMQKKAQAKGKRYKLFTCSLSDFFHRGADEWRPEAWQIIRECPHVDFLVLTKRAHRIAACLPTDWSDGWPNVWLGVSVGRMHSAHRVDTLRRIPAVVRFISAEPLLESLADLNLDGIHWVNAGGESGENYRYMDARWAEELRKKCEAAKVSFFFKQGSGFRSGMHENLLVQVQKNWPIQVELKPEYVQETLRLAKCRRDRRSSSSLAERFTAPPFSILDLKQGYWQKRQQAWTALGISGEAGRGSEHEPVYSLGLVNFGARTDISTFNAALAETIYQWFAPAGGGDVLDPFAGGSTRGVVAARLGHKYTGIELRAEQVEENRRQAERIGVAPTWICGDSTTLSSLIGDREFDFIFACPPYFDRERYTAENERDLSRCKTYEEFMGSYESVFRQAVARLKEHRAVVVVVGEIRDQKGFCRGFVADTIHCFRRLGLQLYNDLVLATPIGSCPLRSGKQFTLYRKVQKVHQNVLCFWKGDDAKQIPTALGMLGTAESESTERAA